MYVRTYGTYILHSFIHPYKLYMFVQVLYDETYQRGRLAKSTQYYSCVSATYYTIK